MATNTRCVAYSYGGGSHKRLNYHEITSPFHDSHSVPLLPFCQSLQTLQWPAPAWSSGVCPHAAANSVLDIRLNPFCFCNLLVWPGFVAVSRTSDRKMKLALVIPWSSIVSQSMLLLLCIASKICRCLAPFVVIAFTLAPYLIVTMLCRSSMVFMGFEVRLIIVCIVYPCVVMRCSLLVQFVVAADIGNCYKNYYYWPCHIMKRHRKPKPAVVAVHCK